MTVLKKNRTGYTQSSLMPSEIVSICLSRKIYDRLKEDKYIVRGRIKNIKTEPSNTTGSLGFVELFNNKRILIEPHREKIEILNSDNPETLMKNIFRKNSRNKDIDKIILPDSAYRMLEEPPIIEKFFSIPFSYDEMKFLDTFYAYYMTRCFEFRITCDT